jgi:hypothetical protein
MYIAAKSVSQAVREVLASNTMYQEILESGLANFTAMAERIKPEVESKAQTRVNTNTIVAALKRLANHIVIETASKGLKGSVSFDVRVSLNDSIFDLDFQAEQCGDLFALVDKVINTEDVTFLFQTSSKWRMFTESTRLYDEAQRSLSDQIRSPIQEKLSRITLNFSPVKEKNMLNNLLLEISKFLYNARIEIRSAFFTPSDIVLILNDGDAVKLYNMLHTDLADK